MGQSCQGLSPALPFCLFMFGFTVSWLTWTSTCYSLTLSRTSAIPGERDSNHSWEARKAGWEIPTSQIIQAWSVRSRELPHAPQGCTEGAAGRKVDTHPTSWAALGIGAGG